MRPLTIIIPTYNEADNLKELLPLVEWADELLIVDSFSTDETIPIAESYGARILQRSYQNSANQKNWTIPQAQHEWIFLIDADERPSIALIQEIKAILAEPVNREMPMAYWVARQNIFMGKLIRFSGWQNDAVIRFFHRDHCRYEEKAVHAEIITTAKVAKLKHQLIHYTYKSMSHFLAKMERYAYWSAKDHLTKTPRITFFHLHIKPAFRFFKHYILKQGFRDGKVGYIVSKVMAWGVFLRYTFMREMLESKKQKNQ